MLLWVHHIRGNKDGDILNILYFCACGYSILEQPVPFHLPVK